MNGLNRVATSVFDVLLTPFELLGAELSLVLVSGISGILALIAFKHISWQAGIKGTKDKIKGDMIAIRIYQDDLRIVARSVGRVVLRNFQYLGLNFGPILPLLVPFTIVAAQLVVRYAYAPIPVTESAAIADMLPGEGTMVRVEMKPGEEHQVRRLALRLPSGFEALSPLARSTSEGLALQEIVATRAGSGEIEILIDGQRVATKRIVAGAEPDRRMQPTRVAGFWVSWLWPAEDVLPGDSPIDQVQFQYPPRDLFLLPGGDLGIFLVFVVASIAFALAILKPLHIQI